MDQNVFLICIHQYTHHLNTLKLFYPCKGKTVNYIYVRICVNYIKIVSSLLNTLLLTIIWHTSTCNRQGAECMSA